MADEVDDAMTTIRQMSQELHAAPEFHDPELRVSAVFALLIAEIGLCEPALQEKMVQFVHGQLETGLDHFDELCQAPRLLTTSANTGTIH